MVAGINIIILDPDLWKWTKMRSSETDLENISQYEFRLIKQDKEQVGVKGGKIKCLP